MMIRVNSELLDFNDDVDVIKQSKLFEAIDLTMGDFSYSFEIPLTTNNLRILTYPFPDVSSKKVYQKVECEILDDEGILIYSGFLRIEKINTVIKCSFFSGNTNWIASLSGLISALDFSEFDTTISVTNIINSWAFTDGIKFTFADYGNLLSRSHGQTVQEDWTPSIFVKTIFKKIFQAQGIKIQGELLEDAIFDKLLVCSNPKNQNDIDNGTCSIAKTDVQTINPTFTNLLTFNDDTTYPFHNTVNNDYDLSNSKFISPIPSVYRVKIAFTSIAGGLDPHLTIRKNGSAYLTYDINSPLYNRVIYIPLIPGDYIDFTVTASAFGPVDISKGTLEITPFFIFNIKGNNILPKWTQQNFVKAILSIFNVVSFYDSYSKTLTFNLFDKVKTKQCLDLSQYVTITDEDYIEFVSNYAQNNHFIYSGNSNDSADLKKYNVKNYLQYGAGNISINNHYIQKTTDVLKSDFTSPISYINKQFGSPSLERLNLLELTDSDSVIITSVSNSSGICRFNISADIFQPGNLVRIEIDNGNISLDGEWVVGSVGSGYFEVLDLLFSSTGDTGKATLLITTPSSNDDSFLLIDANKWDYLDMSTFKYLYIWDSVQFATTETNACFFNMLDIQKPISRTFKQGLSFGSINNILNFQRNILETYWNSFRDIMNDPAKIFADGRLPKNIYKQISPLNPVFIKTEKSSNLYYVNKITGYKNSYTPCVMELIKL